MFIFTPNNLGEMNPFSLIFFINGLTPPPRYDASWPFHSIFLNNLIPDFWCEKINQFSHLGEWHSEQHKHEMAIQLVV